MYMYGVTEIIDHLMSIDSPNERDHFEMIIMIEDKRKAKVTSSKTNISF